MRRIIPIQPTLEELTHFGVTGMKWGIRKDRLSAGLKKAGELAGRAVKAVGRGAAQLGKDFMKGSVRVAKATGQSMAKTFMESAKPLWNQKCRDVRRNFDKMDYQAREQLNSFLLKFEIPRMTFKSNRTMRNEHSQQRSQDWEERRRRYADQGGRNSGYR
jgi:hypothetical protein